MLHPAPPAVTRMANAAAPAGVRSRGATAAGFVSILGLAVFLRTWRIIPHGTLPDTYEQIRATRRLLAGEFPVSDLYPPGIAIVLAPFFAVLPDTVSTVQVAVVTFSLALVALAYVVARRAGADTGTALLFTGAICIAPGFVQMGRVGLFDGIGTTLLVLCIVLAPAVRRLSWPAWIAYAALLAVALTVRLTNVFVLPAVAMAYAGVGREWRRPVRDALRSGGAWTIAAAASGFTLLLMLPGLVSSESSEATMTLDGFGVHLALYYAAIAGGLAAPLVVPLALIGAQRLWRASPTTALVTAYFLVVWPVAHAPFPFAEERYMLPAMFFVLLAASYGPAELWEMAQARARRPRAIRQATAVALSLGVAVIYALFVGGRLADWRGDAGQSDESALRELRPVVDALEGDPLIVTAMARGLVSDDGDPRFIDLMDRRIAVDDAAASTDEVLTDVTLALRDGRRVYYVYGRLEDDREDIGLLGPGVDIYFAAIDDRFALTEVFRAKQEEYRVYRVGR